MSNNHRTVTQTVTVEYLGTDTTPAPARWTLQVDVRSGTPQIRVGWADREASARVLPVYTDRDASGVSVYVADDGSVRASKGSMCDAYPCELPAWADDVARAAVIIREAAGMAESERPDVAAACASYREILARIDADIAEHQRLWREQWAPEIARRFRRKTVCIGEQTVPGKVCVRSSRGTLLGYARCWDGRWLGVVDRAR